MRTVLLVALAALLSACSAGAPAGRTGAVGTVVAAENVWGSIASQLGGDKVRVTSIISSPNADPHEYEATAT
ncbi:MAG: metal ABC transporter solute-binding protein, Zn/Mn family, partial [Actinomycetota bacterium]